MFESWWNTEIGVLLTFGMQALFIAVSVSLTVHILLNKSDPKASLMWIALVWFAPVFGAVFYLLFGINRISRRAARLEESPQRSFSSSTEYEHPASDQEESLGLEFHRLGNFVTRSHRTLHNRIEILQGVTEIHDEMRRAIEAADTSIILSTFIFKNDTLGKEIAQTLVRAAQRGVDVKVLLDGVGRGPFSSRIRKRLENGGVDLQRFLHGFWPWRAPFLNLRNHRKILVIDGRTAFTGSLNIGRVKNLETHFKIHGPVTKQFTETFKKDWALACGKALPDDVLKKNFERSGNVIARGIRSGPAYENERLRWIILGALGCAKREIRVVTPYFIPDRGLLSGLTLAALKGVDVEIVLPKHSNFPFADWAAEHQLKGLIEAGCNIYRRSDLFDHSKLMTIDGKWALVGSSNWDARSLRLNFEFDLECEDSEFIANLNEVIAERRVNSSLVRLADLENSSMIKRLRDASARLLLPYL
ncbi:MAG: phospholipase D-like domain-containing protein [Litorimonas sp.]